MARRSLGGQELEVLRYVADHGPATVGQVAEGFGQGRGLARSTIQTVMERLRRKGYLKREPVAGVYRYSSGVPKPDLLRALVGDFTERVLGGSLEPFLAYLSRDAQVSDAELDELKEIVRQLESRRKEGKR